VNLGKDVAVSRVVIYNRNDGDARDKSIVSGRLSNSLVSLKDNQGRTVKSYSIGDATNVPVFDINFDSYLGCYADNVNRRNLPHWAAGNLNPNGAIQCSALCKAAGFKLAGTQHSNECWCGNSLNGAQPVSNNECNMQCLGNAAEMCGGPSQNSVYIISVFEFNVDRMCDQLLQQFHRVDEELSVQGKWQGGSVTGVCKGWGTDKVGLGFSFSQHILMQSLNGMPHNIVFAI
jgi:hypothetical protein